MLFPGVTCLFPYPVLAAVESLPNELFSEFDVVVVDVLLRGQIGVVELGRGGVLLELLLEGGQSDEFASEPAVS